MKIIEEEKKTISRVKMIKELKLKNKTSNS